MKTQKLTPTNIAILSYVLVIAYIYGMGWLLWFHPLVAVGVVTVSIIGIFGLILRGR